MLDSLRLQQVEALGATSLEEGAYQNGYGCIARLHIINEMEQMEKLIDEIFAKSSNREGCKAVIERVAKEWELRLKVGPNCLDFLLFCRWLF